MQIPKYITHIFFDLDHTLWDFDRNSAETLALLLDRYNIAPTGSLLSNSFLSQYKITNKAMWQLYNYQKITKDELRYRRFREAFGKVGVDINFDVDQFGEDYIELCTRMPHVFENAHEILDHASKKYTVAIITNGFLEATYNKLEHSGLMAYFKPEHILITENIGVQKPHKKVFETALLQTNGKAQHALMVGDNIDSDIGGAYNSGICPVWFNPYHEEQTLYQNLVEINELKSLMNYI
ncbi:MAG: YjjG family noncanonical pyrimidine nucleotidase [Bacteroidota bacterium]|nr:YjjG family noncanonical pyrimidine nucleotidase [Bacteroidota bacterium]